MTDLFISDLHLDANRPEISRAFERFMAQIAVNARRLYILGDFFEVWIGDDDPSEFNRGIIARAVYRRRRRAAGYGGQPGFFAGQ